MRKPLLVGNNKKQLRRRRPILSTIRQRRFVLELIGSKTNYPDIFVWADDPSVYPYLCTGELSDELKTACLIKMQLRPDGSSVSSINGAIGNKTNYSDSSSGLAIGLFARIYTQANYRTN